MGKNNVEAVYSFLSVTSQHLLLLSVLLCLLLALLERLLLIQKEVARRENPPYLRGVVMLGDV